jgi:hypothetical protein
MYTSMYRQAVCVKSFVTRITAVWTLPRTCLSLSFHSALMYKSSITSNLLNKKNTLIPIFIRYTKDNKKWEVSHFNNYYITQFVLYQSRYTLQMTLMAYRDIMCPIKMLPCGKKNKTGTLLIPTVRHLTLSVRAEYIYSTASRANSPDGVYILRDFHKVVKWPGTVDFKF